MARGKAFSLPGSRGVTGGVTVLRCVQEVGVAG